MSAPDWRYRLAAYLSSPAARLALGVFLVVGVVMRSDDPRWQADLLVRLFDVATLLAGCYLIGRTAARPS